MEELSDCNFIAYTYTQEIMAHNFKQLLIWQKSMDLTDLIYDYVETLPRLERFNLIDQMNRSACSIPTNIAEGSGKRTNRHFAEFLSTALTSAFELETQLLICERRNYGNTEMNERGLVKVNEVQKMIFKFRERIAPDLS